MQGFPPLKTMTIKIEPRFGPTPHVQGSLFQDLLGISRIVFRNICSPWFSHNGFFAPLQQGYEPLGQRERYPAIAKLLLP